MSITKKVYFAPLLWSSMGLSSIHRSMVHYPPRGYEFILPSHPLEDRVFNVVSKIKLPGLLANYVFDKVASLNLTIAYMEDFREIPQAADLIYSLRPIFRKKKPWVISVEHVGLIVSCNPHHFKRYRKIVQNAFASEYCKKILCYTEVGKKSVLLNLDCSVFEQKLDILPRAVPKRDFTKSFNEDKIKLLLVDSAQTPQFEIKGIREALAAFAFLNRKYSNLELVVRSQVPKDIKKEYLGCSNIRIIHEIVPWQMLEQEFKSADIFFLPVHSPPSLTFLDAMSYELPVVTIDAPGNSELVEDGKTGFLVNKSEKIPYFTERFIPSFGSREFHRAIRAPDPEVVAGLVEKVSILIESEELRRRMGKAGRWEVEHGKFSIKSMNEKLQRIFDEATA
ncbi:glycosyltransferase family 4 protein [Chloroflexota bacterium]